MNCIICYHKPANLLFRTISISMWKGYFGKRLFCSDACQTTAVFRSRQIVDQAAKEAYVATWVTKEVADPFEIKRGIKQHLTNAINELEDGLQQGKEIFNQAEKHILVDLMNRINDLRSNQKLITPTKEMLARQAAKAEKNKCKVCSGKLTLQSCNNQDCYARWDYRMPTRKGNKS